jgi:hypothetical protein
MSGTLGSSHSPSIGAETVKNMPPPIGTQRRFLLNIYSIK